MLITHSEVTLAFSHITLINLLMSVFVFELPVLGCPVGGSAHGLLTTFLA